MRVGFKSRVETNCTFGNASEFKRRDFCVVCEDGVFVYDGLSAGLAKRYSKGTSPLNEEYFKSQLTPLECVIEEFLISLSLNREWHSTLDLAYIINKSLSEAAICP
jgi:hypothetical protein